MLQHFLLKWQLQRVSEAIGFYQAFHSIGGTRIWLCNSGTKSYNNCCAWKTYQWFSLADITDQELFLSYYQYLLSKAVIYDVKVAVYVHASPTLASHVFAYNFIKKGLTFACFIFFVYAFLRFCGPQGYQRKCTKFHLIQGRFRLVYIKTLYFKQAACRVSWQVVVGDCGKR